MKLIANSMGRQFWKRVTFGLLAVGLTAPTAMADWDEFWHNVSVGYQRNNAWPDPFNEVDALEVVRPFEQMKHNGWKLHHTIGHELFRQGDGVLMPAGSNRIYQIATQAPQSRRSIYVLRGYTAAETDARVAAVRRSLSTMHIQGPSPQVLITDVAAPTASGAWAGRIGREWINSLPKPQLPSTSANGEQSAATPIGN